jgi:hypothetical protein
MRTRKKSGVCAEQRNQSRPFEKRNTRGNIVRHELFNAAMGSTHRWTVAGLLASFRESQPPDDERLSRPNHPRRFAT